MSTRLARELKTLCLKPTPSLRLAVAESLTGGQVQAAITAVPGASAFFLGGVTAYSIDQKVKLLGVNRAAAKRVNSVSAAVATQMARGVAELFGSDLAVATTGYAEPAAAQGVTDPFAYWAIAHRVSPRRWQVLTGQVVCPGQKRTEVQATVAEIVLAELVDYLKTIAP